MTRHRHLRVLAVAAILLATVPFAGPVQAATPDLTLVTSATYLVQPAQSRIQVVLDVTAASHKAETKTSMYYFDHAMLLVQAGAATPKVSGLKGARVTIAKKDSKSTTLRIDFGKRLYGGTSATFKLSFLLPDPKGAAGSLVRVGASLVTVPVWAFGTPSTPGSSVAVEFPPGYDVAVESGVFAATGTTAAGGTRLTTGSLSNPLAFFAFVSAQQPPEWTDTPLSVAVPDGTVELLMRAWADDPLWAGRVGKVLAGALPILRDEIGFSWPHTDPVTVQEAVSRTGGGHAGRYDATGQAIEVAYWAGSQAVIHEAVHGWLNGRVVADRWAVEGFAALYANRTAVKLGAKLAPPALTDAQKAAAYPLNAWPVEAGVDPAVDSYGFAASAILAAAIADRVGDDVLRQVWVAAADRVGAYQPPVMATASGDVTETVDGTPDWRGMLDLLGDASGQDLSDLWRTWVVRPGEAGLLDDRAAARSAYSKTLAVANGWALPRTIRDALRAWRFDTADTLMADARAVLQKRVALEHQAAAAGLALPDTLRTLFETGSLAAASSEADRESAAITAITTATASRTDQHDVLSTVGMIGERPEADLAAAALGLAEGHVDASVAASSSAYRAWTGAWAEGRRRLVFLLAVLASAAILGPSVWTRVGRPRLRSRQLALRP